jgi:uncharacterized protein YsxB (DUF464 family)
LTTVIFLRSKDGLLYGFRAIGHADYAEIGSDIVCAGISTLLQSSILGIERYLEAPGNTVQTKGYLVYTLSLVHDDRIIRGCDLVLNTARLGIKAISKQFPRHVRVVIVDR